MAVTYPIVLDLEGATCLVVGGGAVAERKVGGLLEAGARVRLVSPARTPTLETWAAAGRIEAIRADYAPAHLEGAVLVFAATNDRAVNAQVATDAKARGLLVNVADSPEEGQFLVPSVVRRGDLCIGISTSGHSPLLAARIRERIEALFAPEYADLLQIYGQIRDTLKAREPDAARRRLLLVRLLEKETELLEILRVQGIEAARMQAQVWLTEERS